MVRFFRFRKGHNNNNKQQDDDDDGDGDGENNNNNNQPENSSNKRNGNSNRYPRKRLLATARTPELLRERHAMFRYALNEFAQTVQPGTTNDDGKQQLQCSWNEEDPEQLQQQQQQQPVPHDVNRLTSSRRLYSPPMQQQQQQQPEPPPLHQEQEPDQQQQQQQQVPPISSSSTTTTTLDSQQQQHNHLHHNHNNHMHRDHSNALLPSFDSMRVEPALSSTPYLNADSLRQEQNHPGQPPPSIQRQQQEQQQQQHNSNNNTYYAIRSPFEDELPPFGYEETYGDAYTDAPLKYLYPRGYQSMRPRSAPWRLSVLICLLFTWLSIFIVGHCSDQANGYYNNASSSSSSSGGYGYQHLFYSNRYYNTNNNNNADGSDTNDNNSSTVVDDDSLLIEMRWCGSRPLYLMWVASMLITGLAASYCSVIGYIKCRDFAVANSRSQPPWMASAASANAHDGGGGGYIPTKSDYYVSLQNSRTSSHFSHSYHHNNGGGSSTYQGGAGYAGSVVSGSDYSNTNITATGRQPRHYSHHQQSTIYQADGTPQFWGSHIYRPTQAAVAVTSR